MIFNEKRLYMTLLYTAIEDFIFSSGAEQRLAEEWLFEDTEAIVPFEEACDLADIDAGNLREKILILQAKSINEQKKVLKVRRTVNGFRQTTKQTKSYGDFGPCERIS